MKKSTIKEEFTFKECIKKIKSIFSKRTDGCNDNVEVKNDTQVTPSIVFVNKPITDINEDIVGFNTQINTIKEAVDNGAEMIALVAEYGAGKSSIADILYKDEKYYQKIRINLWDSVSVNEDADMQIEKNTVEDKISLLTKSFLYQLANGFDSKEENVRKGTKLTSYVTKRLSSSHNLMSFASSSEELWSKLFYCVMSVGAYLVLHHGEKISSFFQNPYMMFFRDISPVFLIIGIYIGIKSIKESSVIFSNIKKNEANKAEINDVFDVYNIIAENLYKNDFDAKQIIVIEDLDRIVDRSLIVGFLKEIYRFHNLLPQKLQSEFVFIIALKPESSLKGETSDDKNIYSKLFDLIIHLKPIHLSDYEAVLLNLINSETNKKQKEKLVQLLTGKEFSKDNDIFRESLPSGFKWLVEGNNLTIRTLKDRLNHAIEIMVSLTNKDYKSANNKSAIKFEKCAAVAYLESAFPEEFNGLLYQEKLFDEFIRKSYSIKNNCGKESLLNELKKEFTTSFKNNKILFSEGFIEAVCQLTRDNILDDDFRMYFYTYPDKCYIKTEDEKDICNLIKLPTFYQNYEELDEKVERIFSERPNTIVTDVIKNIDKEQEYPDVLLLNDTLFKVATECNCMKIIQLLRKNIIEAKFNKEKNVELLKRIQRCNAKNKAALMDGFVQALLKGIIDNSWSDDEIIEYRKSIIDAFGYDVLAFKTIFLNGIKKMPQISADEVRLINNINIVLDLINMDNMDNSMTYIFDAINQVKLSEDSYKKAFDIYDTIISEEDIDESFSEKILDFLLVNQVISVEWFDIIIEKNKNTTKICEYVNLFCAKKLPLEYLRKLDEKAIIGNLNDDVLDRLRDENLYTTYFLNRGAEGKFDGIEYGNKEISGKVMNSCTLIYEIAPDVFMALRKYIICTLQNVYELYQKLFEEGFPIITKEELNCFNNFSDAIICIDASRLTVDNCDFVWEYCNQDVRSSSECFNLFNYLFNSEWDHIVDETVADKLFYKFDFCKIQFNKLDEEKKDTILGYLKPLLLKNSHECINVMNHLRELIPEVEIILQSNGDCEHEYIDLMNTLKSYTTYGIEWLGSANVDMPLCAELTDALYKRGAYKNCVIGKTLYDGKLFYKPQEISIEIYLEIYLTVPAMFEYLVSYKPFIKKVIKEEMAKKVVTSKHAMMFSHISNDAETLKYAFSLISSGDERRQYILNIPEISTEEDSVEIQKYLCSGNVLKDLAGEHIKNKVMTLLWNDEPVHKQEFSDIWDKAYKGES